MKPVFAVLVFLVSSAALASVDCEVVQDGKVIQREGVYDVSFSGPITNEGSAAFSILTQPTGRAYLCIITAVSADGISMCTSGQTPVVLELEYNSKAITCSVQ